MCLEKTSCIVFYEFKNQQKYLGLGQSHFELWIDLFFTQYGRKRDLLYDRVFRYYVKNVNFSGGNFFFSLNYVV